MRTAALLKTQQCVLTSLGFDLKFNGNKNKQLHSDQLLLLGVQRVEKLHNIPRMCACLDRAYGNYNSHSASEGERAQSRGGGGFSRKQLQELGGVQACFVTLEEVQPPPHDSKSSSGL